MDWRQQSTNTETGMVLVIDPERPLREMLCRWLNPIGFRCLCADGIDLAISLLETNKVDVVISEISLPNRLPEDVIFELRSKIRDVASIVLTSANDPELAVTALRQGIAGYLLKPIQRHQLHFEIGRVLRHFRNASAAEQYASKLEACIVTQTDRLRSAQVELFHRLVVASLVRDDETGMHVKRIGHFSGMIAEELGWDIEQVQELRLAAPMHDLGKIGIPDSILLKPGPLTEDEFSIMKSHTVIGARILSNSDSPMIQLAEKIALSHHEWWNGRGYPNGIDRESIPIVARIVSIVDVYDALTHDRIYRKALPEQRVLEYLREGTGTQFDPHLVDAFFSVLPRIRECSQNFLEPSFEKESERCTDGSMSLFSPNTEAILAEL